MRRPKEEVSGKISVNDEGNAVARGNDTDYPGYKGSDKYYCGQKRAIVGSDGRCGPSAGPQCASCLRFQKKTRVNAAEEARLVPLYNPTQSDTWTHGVAIMAGIIAIGVFVVIVVVQLVSSSTA